MSKTVLVIDDEDLVREMLREIQVLLAEDVASGLAVLREGEKNVDLVLLDGTPGGDRRTALQDIRAVRPGVPVVVMSGEPWENLERHFRGLPVAGYLGKPFNVGRILEALDVLTHR